MWNNTSKVQLDQKTIYGSRLSIYFRMSVRIPIQNFYELHAGMRERNAPWVWKKISRESIWKILKTLGLSSLLFLIFFLKQEKLNMGSGTLVIKRSFAEDGCLITEKVNICNEISTIYKQTLKRLVRR